MLYEEEEQRLLISFHSPGSDGDAGKGNLAKRYT